MNPRAANGAPVPAVPAAEPLDLAAIMEAAPPQRVAFLELERIDFGSFGLGELLELSRAAGVEPDELGALMRGGAGGKGRLGVALAWTIARRREPDLTLEDVATWKIEIRGRTPPVKAGRRNPRPPATPTASRRRGHAGSSGSPGGSG